VSSRISIARPAEYAIHNPGHAILRRQDGWFYCLSGIVTPPVETRWGQDRQNFVSIWHEHTGLVVGGGNSKNQPEWSSFSVGHGTDAAYLPKAASLRPGKSGDTLSLDYGEYTCTAHVRIMNARSLELCMEGPTEVPATGQLLLRLVWGQEMVTDTGDTRTLAAEPVILRAPAKGMWVGCGSWRFRMPAGSQFAWPVLPFNPYAADGAAPQEEAEAILRIPLAETPRTMILETT